jgi:hypothetical protein
MMCILTIRGEVKVIPSPQDPNTCCTPFAAQTWPQVISSSLGVSKENYLITIVRAGTLWNVITEIFTGVDQEVLLNVFESWVNQLK